MRFWHYGGCLNKRAARLRLAVQAPAITTTEQSETQSAQERAVAAEPLGGPHLSPVRRYLSGDALRAVFVYISAACILSHTAQYPLSNAFDTEECTLTYSRSSRISVYNFGHRAIVKRQNKPK